MTTFTSTDTLLQNALGKLLFDSISSSAAGKEALRNLSGLVGASAASGFKNSSIHAGAQLAASFFGNDSPLSGNAFSLDSGNGAALPNLANLLLGVAALGIFSSSARTTSTESARSQTAQSQWDAMRLSPGQQAVALAQMIRRAERNL